MLQALARWAPRERMQLATLINRMTDDFLAYMASQDIDAPARAAGSG